MSNTLNIHAKFKGVVADTIDEMIRSGMAASRSEAIRLAIIDYRHHHLLDKSRSEDDSFLDLGRRSLAKELDNSKDENAAEWYLKQLKKGAYHELNES
jgi:Arc/MetJ-type ribon-helix-helix transcriptional regulator